MLAVAFLEAAINEHFAHAVDMAHVRPTPIDHGVQGRLRGILSAVTLERLPLFDRYGLVLGTIGERIDWGRSALARCGSAELAPKRSRSLEARVAHR
jgi:hypothetical protein